MQRLAILLTARKFRVERVDFRGRQHDLIVHPGAAVILPVHADGRIVLLSNQRAAVDGALLELPAGTLEPPETPAACAARELREETGYTSGRLMPLMKFYSAPGFCTELLHAFLATDLQPGTPQREPGEELEVHELEPSEALAAIRTGLIQDAKTIATLLYYETFVHGRSG